MIIYICLGFIYSWTCMVRWGPTDALTLLATVLVWPLAICLEILYPEDDL